jgi:hypothetical protein
MTVLLPLLPLLPLDVPRNEPGTGGAVVAGIILLALAVGVVLLIQWLRRRRSGGRPQQ